MQITPGYGLWTAGIGFQAGVEEIGAMAVLLGPQPLPKQLESHVAPAPDRPDRHGVVRVPRRRGDGPVRKPSSFRIAILGAEQWGEKRRSMIEALTGADLWPDFCRSILCKRLLSDSQVKTLRIRIFSIPRLSIISAFSSVIILPASTITSSVIISTMLSSATLPIILSLRLTTTSSPSIIAATVIPLSVPQSGSVTSISCATSTSLLWSDNLRRQSLELCLQGPYARREWK